LSWLLRVAQSVHRGHAEIGAGAPEFPPQNIFPFAMGLLADRYGFDENHNFLANRYVADRDRRLLGGEGRQTSGKLENAATADASKQTSNKHQTNIKQTSNKQRSAARINFGSVVSCDMIAVLHQMKRALQSDCSDRRALTQAVS
jgi:hypothetical protein